MGRNALLAPFLFTYGYMHYLAELGSEQLDFSKSFKKCDAAKRKAAKQLRAAFFNAIIRISKSKPQSTPTPHLLLSNIPPNGFETVAILNHIHQAEAEMERCVEQLMTSRGNTWKGLTLFKHEQTVKCISEHKAIISPIRRLPSEILQEIFLHAVDEEPRGLPWHNLTDAPYGISQVSNLWRKTALNTPALWTRIPAIHVERKFTTKPRYLAYIAMILSRTRGAPLKICFYGPDFTVYDGPHPVIELLIAHSMSWKSLTIEISSLELSIFDAVKGRLPLLETLVIRGWHFISPISDVPIDIFYDAPRLRQVKLHHMKSKMVDLPFSQLVQYDQEEGHSGQLVKLFNSDHLSNLETLSLLIYDGLHISLIGTLITLSSLTVLKLRFRFSTTQFPILDQLFLPLLEELSIDSYATKKRLFSIEPIAALIKRGGCPLKKLYIRSFSTAHGELTALLQQIPSLTHLTTDIPTVDDLQNLIHDGNRILPCLENCSFFTEEALQHDCIDCCRMLAVTRSDPQPESESTDSGNRKLRSFYIHYPTKDIAKDQQNLFQQWSDTPVSLRLSDLRTRIVDCLPELTGSLSSRYFGRGKGTSKLRSEVSSILSAIQEVPVDDARDVYASGIHETLRRAHVEFEGMSGPKFHVRQSFKLILEQWEPLFSTSIDDFRWMTLFPSSLLYVSDSNAIRASPESARQMVFGELWDGILSPSDLPWPPSF